MTHFGNWTENKTACGVESNDWTDDPVMVDCPDCLEALKATAEATKEISETITSVAVTAFEDGKISEDMLANIQDFLAKPTS